MNTDEDALLSSSGTVRRIRAEDQARTTRVARPRFTLVGCLFHAMISYRVETEGRSGNNLSFELYEKIRQLSLEGDTTIPKYAQGIWPQHSQRPARYQPEQAKVYLDRECLLDGCDWETGFIQGLSSSMVMVCLLSFNEHGCGSLGSLTTLCPSEGKDRVDNLLTELIVGQELRALGEHTAQSTHCAIFAILPILVGPQRQDSSFEPFPCDKLGLLSPEPSVMTNDRAASILAMLGVGDEKIQTMQARSVRQHVDRMLANEGVEASTFENQDELVLQSARRCLMVIKLQIFKIRTHPRRFANNRPGGQEVLDWLREKQLSSYAPIFLHYGLDNLPYVMNLSRQQVSQLAEEYRDMELGLFSPSLDSGDCRDMELRRLSWTQQAAGSTQSELHLWEAITSLADARDPRTRKMAERLEWFEDSSAAWHCRGETTSRETTSPNMPTLTLICTLSIHTVWAKNCIERFMELQTIFIILCVSSLFNLVQMQKNYVTCTDYCQERYIRRVEEFVFVLWAANIRRLGYNGRTIPIDICCILRVSAIRAGFRLLFLVHGRPFPGKDAEEIDIFRHMLRRSIITPCVITYRPEYFCFGMFGLLGMHLGEFLASCFSIKSRVASWVIFSLAALYVSFWESYFRVVFGRKATEKATLCRLGFFSHAFSIFLRMHPSDDETLILSKWIMAPWTMCRLGVFFLIFIRMDYDSMANVPTWGYPLLILSIFLEDFVVSSKLTTSAEKPLIMICLALSVVFWEWFHRVVSGRKTIKAMQEVTRFRGAWLECSEGNPDAVTKLAKLCKGITVRLDQQREEALRMLPWYRQGLAYLEQRVGRWSLLCKGKARQKSTDLDVLMENAGAVNEMFQDLVSDIGFNGSFVHHTTGLEFLAGPVKQPLRTIEKLVRRYRRDVGCLTDLVRCTVIADSLENVESFLQLLYSKSVVGLNTSFEEEGNGSEQGQGKRLDTGDEIFRITALENRFDPSYADATSMGYRDLALNIEVGWRSDTSDRGIVSFQKVCDWRRLNCITHICEIQVRTRAIHECTGHEDYLALRNVFSR